MPQIKGICNLDKPTEYYWKLVPASYDSTGCRLVLVDHCGSYQRDVLEISNGRLIRYGFTAEDAAELGLTVNADGYLATVAECAEMEEDD